MQHIRVEQAIRTGWENGRIQMLREKHSQINENEHNVFHRKWEMETQNLETKYNLSCFVFITVRSKLHEVNPRCNPICREEGVSEGGTPGWLADWLDRGVTKLREPKTSEQSISEHSL